jgi:hypothetical protein
MNKRKNTHTDRFGNIRRKKCCATRSRKKLEYVQEFRYRDTTNVEPKVYNYNSNNWSHWNSKEKLKEKFGKIYQENIR